MRIALALAAVLAVATPSPAGVYVAGSDSVLVSDASHVIVVRAGTRTIVSLQLAYTGPPEAFALVVPVPTAVQPQDVRTLPHDVFQRVERLTAPRLVEYWEQDPCAARAPAQPAPPADHGVTVEGRLAVGEYQIAILSAKDSAGLDAWLHQEKYTVRPDASARLRPYVESGMKFFVAKVDPTKLAFVGSRAVLSPLRFQYDAEQLVLPIRIGLANSTGTQDLLVHVIAAGESYVAANRPNVRVPTDVDLKPRVSGAFPAFYATLFDATLEAHPRAVITEYTGPAAFSHDDLLVLGADGVDDLVLTRLHTRYGTDLEDDLVLAPAPTQSFAARYAIRHPWRGPLRCNQPTRGVWTTGAGAGGTHLALGLATAPRGTVKLADAVATSIPALGITAGGASVEPPPARPLVEPAGSDAGSTTAKKKPGCGCQSSDPGAPLGLVVFVLLAIRRGRVR